MTALGILFLFFSHWHELGDMGRGMDRYREERFTAGFGPGVYGWWDRTPTWNGWHADMGPLRLSGLFRSIFSVLLSDDFLSYFVGSSYGWYIALYLGTRCQPRWSYEVYFLPCERSPSS
jgi:hypothetical protein